MYSEHELSGERCGLIRRVTECPVPAGFPAALRFWKADLADTTSWGWTTDAGGAGWRFWDDDAGRRAAMGEAIEHYCGSLVTGELVWGSARELIDARFPAIDPLKLALFAPEQYSTPGFPFVPFDDEITVPWVWGRDVRGDTPVLVPASIVYTGYALGTNPGSREPLTNPPINAGIAAGRDLDSALRNALLEIVERDSVWRAWAAKGSNIRCRTVPLWLLDVAGIGNGRFALEIFDFPNAFGLSVTGALLLDREADVQLLGTACREGANDAMAKAVEEAFQLQSIALSLLDPRSPIHESAAKVGALKPFRPARDYASAYRGDWRDLIDQLCHVQFYLDPRTRPLLLTQFAEARTRPPLPVEGQIVDTTLLDRFARQGLRVLAVDVTTIEVRSAGFRVVRAIVPGMYSNPPAAFPFLGGTRIDPQDTPIPPLPYA